MIVFRALQGFSGGVMIPLGFTIILSMLPRSTRSAAARSGLFIPAVYRIEQKMNSSTADNPVQWLFLDLNAFFASCEQQENRADSLLEGEGFEPLVPRLK